MSALYSEHPAMFRNNPVLFVLALILIPAFGIGLIILLIWYLKSISSKLTLYENDILFEKGLLSKERSEIAVSSVRTIKVTQSFFNRIFNVGTVEIYTAGDDPEILATGLPDPNRIRELVKRRQSGES